MLRFKKPYGEHKFPSIVVPCTTKQVSMLVAMCLNGQQCTTQLFRIAVVCKYLLEILMQSNNSSDLDLTLILRCLVYTRREAIAKLGTAS